MWPWRAQDRLFHDTIECLVAALDARDPYTCGHSQRVANLALELARRVGLRGRELELVHVAAHVHDIGKIGVPDYMLRKPGRLFPHERAVVERHAEIGYQILSKCPGLRSVARIVLHHHERWDGRGYPAGLAGLEIPLGARIIALADAVDAMTSHRPYRPALSWDACWAEVTGGRATHFDPVLVDAAEQLWPQWRRRFERATQVPVGQPWTT